MPPTFTLVQSTGVARSNTGSASVSFSALPTAGNVIVVKVGGWVNTVGPTFTLTDNQGNTYRVGAVGPNNSGVKAGIYYLFDIPAPSGTFTISLSGFTWGNLQADEFSGFNTVDPFNVAAVASDGGTAIYTAATAPQGEAVALVCAMFATHSVLYGSATVEASPVWTQVYDVPTVGGGSVQGEADYRITSAIAAQSCHWTANASVIFSSALVVFTSGLVSSVLRENQVVQTIVTAPPPSPLRENQVVQGLTTAGVPVLRWNQVVQTIVTAPSPAPGIILRGDVDGLDTDFGLPYRAYVKTRAIPPQQQVDKMGEIKDPILVAGAAPGVVLQVEVTADLDLRVQDSNVGLTPEGSEPKVMRKCEGVATADAALLQFQIGDEAPQRGLWDLHHFIAPIIGENDK